MVLDPVGVAERLSRRFAERKVTGKVVLVPEVVAGQPGKVQTSR